MPLSDTVAATKQAEQTEAQDGPYWYVYQCAPSNEVRGRNQQGNPCGAWRVVRRRSLILWPGRGQNRAQVRCAACGNRPRLTPGDVLGPFPDEWTAYDVASKKRRGEA